MITRRDSLKCMAGVGVGALYMMSGDIMPSEAATSTTFGATSPGTAITPGSTRVATAADFQAALNSHVLDITLDAVVNAPAGGFVVPRLTSTMTIRGTDKALIQRVDNTAAPCIKAGSGTGGHIILDHIRCDGGWRKFKTAGNGGFVPFRFLSCAYLSFRNCVSCYSRDLAFIFNNTTQAELINCTLWCSCTGAYSDDNVRDLLVQDCWMQHGGDDSLQWHQSADITGLQVRSVIQRHNLIRDYFGGKTHCGVADGTVNGKPSQSLWENNVFEAANRYGTEFNNSPSSNSFHGSPHNFIWQGNTVKNLIKDSPSSRSGAPIGIGLNFMLQSGNQFDSTTIIRNNTFSRDPSIQGKTNQQVYPWAQINGPDKPSWVPGSADQGGGYWSQNGFVSTWKIDQGTKGVILNGTNPGAVTHSGNTFIGSGWTNTLS